MTIQPVKILMIEDNPGDVELVRAVFESARVANTMQVIDDGQLAVDFIIAGQNMPDVILLDINLPKVNGFEILTVIRETVHSKYIPVVMLTSSESDEDIINSYEHRVNCFISKPVDFNKFIQVVRSLDEFWLSVVKLPPSKKKL